MRSGYTVSGLSIVLKAHSIYRYRLKMGVSDTLFNKEQRYIMDHMELVPWVRS
jgi:hypothetical protein